MHDETGSSRAARMKKSSGHVRAKPPLRNASLASPRRAAWMPRRICRAAGGRVVAAAEPIPKRAPRVPTRPRQVRVAWLASRRARCFFYFRCSSRPVHCSAQAVEVPFWKAAKEGAMRTGGRVLSASLGLWGRLGPTHGPRLPLSAICGSSGMPRAPLQVAMPPPSPVPGGEDQVPGTLAQVLRIGPCNGGSWRILPPGDTTKHAVEMTK